MQETHPLLNVGDFRKELTELGYEKDMGARIFYPIVRRALQGGLDHTSDSVVYIVKTRTGEEEPLISIPNLVDAFPDIGSIMGIGPGTRRMRAAQELIQLYTPSATEV